MKCFIVHMEDDRELNRFEVEPRCGSSTAELAAQALSNYVLLTGRVHAGESFKVVSE